MIFFKDFKVMKFFIPSGNIDGARDKPSIFIFNGLKKYDKDEQSKIFRVIKNVYQHNDY